MYQKAAGLMIPTTGFVLTCLFVALPAVADWNHEGATLAKFRREGDPSAVVKSLHYIKRTDEVSQQHRFVELPSGSRGILSWSLDPKTGKMTSRLSDEQTGGWFELTLHFGFQSTGMSGFLTQEDEASPEEGEEVLFRVETAGGHSLEVWSPYLAQDASREALELLNRLKIEGFELALKKLRSPFFEELLAVRVCPGTVLEEFVTQAMAILAAVLGDSSQASVVCPKGSRWKQTETATFRLPDPRYEAFLSAFPSGPKHIPQKSDEDP